MALTTSLISFWELGEASGTRSDSHSTNHLTQHNGVSSSGGVVGNCAGLTAASFQYLDIAANASLQVGNIDFTCAGWLYLSSSAAVIADIVGQWNAGTANQRAWVLNQYTDSQIYLNVNSDGASSETYVTGPTLSANTFYFFVCGYDAANDVAFLQINDGTYNTAVWSLGVFTSTAPFSMGDVFSDGSPIVGGYLNGFIDQVGFWKRLLTDPEKTWLYNAGAGRSYADIVAESAARSGFRLRMTQPQG